MAVFRFGERIRDKQLFWAASFTCEHCQYATELDESGQLPQDLRSLLLAQEGIWQLELHSKDSLSLKVIHQVMEITLIELARLKEKIPCVIYEGTEIEVNFYFNRLLELVPNINVTKIAPNR